MRWLIALLALAGIVAASFALREHYRLEASPCSINEKWDCGVVNKSPFAVIGGLRPARGPEDVPQPGARKSMFSAIGEIPVADVGIAGYVLLGLLAFTKRWRLLAAASVLAFAFSCYLAYIEKYILETWCIYCVTSWGIIFLIMLLSVIALIMDLKKPQLRAESRV
jgi:vitamin-K-epoxide reductase (warfarin-sensitive)